VKPYVADSLTHYKQRANARAAELQMQLAPELLALAREYVSQLTSSRNRPALMRELPRAHGTLMTLATGAGVPVLNWMVMQGLICLEVQVQSRNSLPSIDTVASYVRYLDLMFERMARTDYVPDSEEFIKDLRFSFGMSFPVDAWWIDMRSRLAGRLGAWYGIRNPASCIAGLPSHLPCARLYVEPRLLAHFNEATLRRTYLAAAALMVADRSLVGMTVKSWFNDPAVGRISPRLGYLTSIARDGGAKFIRGRTSEKDIARATSKSATRKDLYLQGTYVPTPYSLFWRRDSLIAWAESEVGKP